MNKDHKDSILLYVINYSDIKNPVEAEMLGITSKAMSLKDLLEG